MLIRFKCENDACPAVGEPVEVLPGETAECPRCGWFMQPVVGDRR
jgi:hypothetical protein